MGKKSIPCRHAVLGVLQRYKDGKCALCTKEKATKRRLANPEKAKEIDRRSRKKHREKRLAENKVWRTNNPEKARELNRKWKKNNPDKTRAGGHKQQGVVWHAGQSVASLLEIQKGRCAICGVEFALLPSAHLHVDHDHKMLGRPNVRGLLCQKHNKLLGLANDNPDILLSCMVYLLEWTSKTR
jgi:hypothetical protein